MTRFVRFALASIALLGLGRVARPQAKPLASPQDVQRIYDKLLPQIDRIPIYDNHSHATFPDDSDMDAQAAPPDESSVLRLRDTNPEFVTAAKALFGYPERMMFGSDAFPFNDAVGAEETFWLAARSARTAVAAALAELVAEGAFNEEKALELARMYLHDNAARLYGEMK